MARADVAVIDLTARKVVQTWHQQPDEPVFALTWNAEGTMVAAGRNEKPMLLCRIGEANCRIV